MIHLDNKTGKIKIEIDMHAFDILSRIQEELLLKGAEKVSYSEAIVELKKREKRQWVDSHATVHHSNRTV